MLRFKHHIKYTYLLLTLFAIFALLYVSYDFKLFPPSFQKQIPRSEWFKKSNSSPKYNYTLHIIVVSDVERQKNYQQRSSSVFCYAHRHGYKFSAINPHHYHMCSHITNFYFRKHCTAMMYFIQHPFIDWLVVLDGDTFIVNATRSLDRFIPRDPKIHVIHYERFIDNEIMAGNYIIRNHPWSLLYLYKWSNYFTRISNIGYHNHDNGALHLHFIDMIGIDNQTYNKCASLYNVSHHEGLYMDYVACIKCALKGKRRFEHIILYRRAHGFCRDDGPSPHRIHYLDTFMHGFKGNLNHFYEEPINTLSCTTISNWTPKIRQSLIINDTQHAKRLTKQWEEESHYRYPSTVMYPEVANCWPDCEIEITGEALKNFTSVICNNPKFKT